MQETEKSINLGRKLRLTKGFQSDSKKKKKKRYKVRKSELMIPMLLVTSGII